MKYFLIAFLSSFTVQAADTFYCDMEDLNTRTLLLGSSYSVVVADDGKSAGLYSQVVYPGAEPELNHELKLISGSHYKKVFSTDNSLQDLRVTFTVGQSGQAGILRFFPGEPAIGNTSLYLCEKR
ncbi:MAG: hypothetical protein KDD37_03470 [Bdellovibrionales bacterium]|nr:hypothetical protein [Bdellovibrionales bacterium]